jgi:DNA-binding CsgD family transcriptional regulator
MGLNNTRFNQLQSLPALNGAIEKLGRLQADLISEALRRAVDDMGAAMAHQLCDPLTSLLLYLHEIKQAADSGGRTAASNSVHEITDMAIRETERVCEIMERIGQTVDASIATEAVVVRGCEAIESWTRRSTGHVPPTSLHAGQHSLTRREQEVLALITNGCSNKEGGRRLGISTRTFETHRAHLMAKLGAKNAADLVRISVNEAH